MSRHILVVTGLVAALAGGSIALAQQTPQGRPGMGDRRGPGGPRGPAAGPRGFAGDLGLRGIDLTEAQREQVRGIMQSHQAEFQQAGTRLRDAHRAFGEAVNATPLDEAAVRARSTDIAGAMAEEAILRAKVRAEVFNLLTPEQQQTLNDRKAKMGERARQRQERRR
jgi:protein CpxP